MTPLLGKLLVNAAVVVGRLEAAVLPRSWLMAMGRFAARAIVRCSRSTREALHANGRRLLGPAAGERQLQRFAVGVVTSFADFFVTLLRAPRDQPPADELLRTMVGREHGERVLALRRGVVCVTLHMGCYELTSLLSESYQPAAVVYRPDPYGLFEKLRARSRRLARVRELPTRSPFFGVEALAVLRQGGAVFAAGDVGFVGDTTAEEFDFLGGRAPFHTWPARLSLAQNVPLLPCFTLRCPESGRYRVHLEAPILPEEHRDVAAMMRQLIGVWERYVRAWPEQWLILHRYWRD